MKKMISKLNVQCDMKTKIIEVASMLSGDKQYSRKAAAEDLLIIARELSELETADLRNIVSKIRNKKSTSILGGA